MNIKSEWDSPSGNNDDGDEEEEDRLPTMKRRQFSLQQRIQQWKRQRQSITVTDYQQVLGRFQQGGEEEEEEDGEDVEPTEMKLIQLLCDRTAFRLPVEVAVLSSAVIGQSSSSSSQSNDDDTSSLLADFLTKLQRQRVLEMTTTDGKKSVSSVNYERLEALKERYLSRVPRLFPGGASHPNNIKTESEATEERPLEFPRQNNNNSSVHEEEEEEKSLVECILSLQSAKERENKRISEEIHQLLSKPTAKELSLVEQFRSAAGSHVQEFCQHGTREDCRRVKLQKMRRSSGSASAQPPNLEPCPKLHFVKIIQKHTDESLGDCSFLNTCFHMESCKYVHYRVEVRPKKTVVAVGGSLNFGNGNSLNNSNSNQHHHNSKASTEKRIPAIKEEEAENEAGVSSSSTTTALAVVPKTGTQSPTMTATASAVPLAKTLASATEQPFKRVLFPPQWIKCDLRYFDMSILGKFAIIMADPPWDIHMELPYGTMSDDEMRKLNIPSLQDEGIIFLWVTGRAMELGRECLQLWGYERCDELIWVKTNQLQRIIRTGRTGHWINHGKEHCLVGVKGRPKNLNRGLDCDVIVAEVRATSHKPDEVYGIIERLSPGTRKIELFGRQHNTQPNWVTLGNQLTGLEIVDPALVEQYKRLYPEDAKKFGVL